jgi:hypothetical protein
MNTETKLSLAQLTELVTTLQARIEKLEERNTVKQASQREMTDEDARRILSGDRKDMKHKDVASELNLSYGQIYSCRLGFTFKHIHKEMRDSGTPNQWMK